MIIAYVAGILCVVLAPAFVLTAAELIFRHEARGGDVYEL